MYIDLRFVSIFQVFHEHDDGSSDYDIEHENLLERQFGTLMLDANPNFQIASSEKLNWFIFCCILLLCSFPDTAELIRIIDDNYPGRA